ncbi:hypothetical protein MSG28_014719 [Choristoneura fumiferana]|uniref:Uncharacterized protein n=1 Tax=Choristoneura fumiferana TaxID=7141 RepID=A0ACC0JSN3_CHOFU|nr:hypothetical protein MSG28_014719 [Choristoneura fumiferana]
MLSLIDMVVNCSALREFTSIPPRDRDPSLPEAGEREQPRHEKQIEVPVMPREAPATLKPPKMKRKVEAVDKKPSAKKFVREEILGSVFVKLSKLKSAKLPAWPLLPWRKV